MEEFFGRGQFREWGKIPPEASILYDLCAARFDCSDLFERILGLFYPKRSCTFGIVDGVCRAAAVAGGVVCFWTFTEKEAGRSKKLEAVAAGDSGGFFFMAKISAFYKKYFTESWIIC